MMPLHFTWKRALITCWRSARSPSRRSALPRPSCGERSQYITVFPEDDVVVVHKVDIDTDENNEVKPIEYTATLAMVVAAECFEECK
jgi:hypothetical protein